MTNVGSVDIGNFDVLIEIEGIIGSAFDDRFISGGIGEFYNGGGGVDRIDLSAYGLADFAAVLGLTADVAGKAEIALNGAVDVVKLFGVVEADLSAGDFILA